VAVKASLEGVRRSCTPKAAGTELCNGKDDDCDGQTDEDFDLTTDEAAAPAQRLRGLPRTPGCQAAPASWPPATTAGRLRPQYDTGCEADRRHRREQLQRLP
jgi:hypothetical protein